MKNDSQSPVRRKPSGGVRFVALTTAGNLREAEFADDGRTCRPVEAWDDGAVMRCRLLEERSSCTESLMVEGGAVAVKHRLHLVADRNLAAAWLEPDFIAEALCGGLAAAATLGDGRRLLLGVSPKFGIEQPLRLRSLTVDSGSRADDAPTVEMVLESVDTSFAAEM